VIAVDEVKEGVECVGVFERVDEVKEGVFVFDIVEEGVGVFDVVVFDDGGLLCFNTGIFDDDCR
jgi:hypothetical protein